MTLFVDSGLAIDPRGKQQAARARCGLLSAFWVNGWGKLPGTLLRMGEALARAYFINVTRCVLTTEPASIRTT